MNSKFTDMGLLGMTVVAALQDHTGLIITGFGAIFVGIIRLQQHRQTMKNLRLDEQLKMKELNK
jgi:hypothetical protein